MRFFAFVLAVVLLGAITEEANAGGHSKANTAQAVKAPKAEVPPAKAPQSDAAKEVQHFDKEIAGVTKKMHTVDKLKKQINKVAVKLNTDLSKAQKFALKRNGDSPTLGEGKDGPFGTTGKSQPKSLGDSDLPDGPLKRLRNAIEDDAKADIWTKEKAADKLAVQVQHDAHKVSVELLSEEEELGERSILHDSKKKKPTISPLQQEKKFLKEAQILDKSGAAAHEQQMKAEKETKAIAAAYTKVEKSLNKHAGDLAKMDMQAEHLPKWMQNDVQSLNEMTTESGKLAKVEA